MSALHGRYTLVGWLESQGSEVLWGTATLSPHTDPFRQPVIKGLPDGAPRGGRSRFHVTCWFSQEMGHGTEEGCCQLSHAAWGWQSDSVSICLQGLRHFDDRLFHPVANEQSLCQQHQCGEPGGPRLLLPELLHHRLFWLFTNYYTLSSWARIFHVN